MQIDNIARQSLLYDFYGQLLTERQREVMRMYHEENLSLSEIGGELDISRQGVYDALKNAENTLADYEEKLGLVEKFIENSTKINKIDRAIDELTDDIDADREVSSSRRAELTRKLKEIKRIIDASED